MMIFDGGLTINTGKWLFFLDLSDDFLALILWCLFA